VAFHSRKFQLAEINYKIHDKELLTIVNAFKYLHHYCKGAVHQIQVFLDHQNLEYFTATKVVTGQGQAGLLTVDRTRTRTARSKR